ncbi:MAG: hypothetical protein OYH77_07710 [Pseudomonadota bacterium]|nr:hypothetical protein [Pseudomonadota bacterium]
MNRLFLLAIVMFATLIALPLQALENAQVLPKGVRRVNIKTVQLDLGTEYDANSNVVPLAAPLQKKITFEDVLKTKQGLDDTLLRAFLRENGLPTDQELGELTADLRGRVRVYAPVIAYGLTPRITIAVAMPYYSARTETQVGYRANDDNAQHFINLLADPKYNKVASAREAYENFSNGVAGLEAKLRDNGYEELGAWEKHGLGDMQFAVKSKLYGEDGSRVHLANLSGFVAPTGLVDSPDILTDISFGDGSWDFFSGLMCDQQLGMGITLNQYAKLTYQAPARRVLRMKTADESLAVERRSIAYKLGNKLDAGLSVQFAHDLGIELGLGYIYARKGADRYDAPSEEAALELAKDSNLQSSSIEVKMGYSSVPAFRRKEMPVPFSVGLQYQQLVEALVANRNVPNTKMLTLDVNLYF